MKKLITLRFQGMPTEEIGTIHEATYEGLLKKRNHCIVLRRGISLEHFANVTARANNAHIKVGNQQYNHEQFSKKLLESCDMVLTYESRENLGVHYEA